MENTMYITIDLAICIFVVSLIYLILSTKNNTKKEFIRCDKFINMEKQLDAYINMFFKQRIGIEQIKGGGTLKTLSVEKNIETLCYDISMNTMKALINTDFYHTLSLYINKSDLTDIIYNKIHERIRILILSNSEDIYGDR